MVAADNIDVFREALPKGRPTTRSLRSLTVGGSKIGSGITTGGRLFSHRPVMPAQLDRSGNRKSSRFCPNLVKLFLLLSLFSVFSRLLSLLIFPNFFRVRCSKLSLHQATIKCHAEWVASPYHSGEWGPVVGDKKNTR